MIGAITLAARSTAGAPLVHPRPTGTSAAAVVGFLRCVLGTVPGKVIVVWDGGTKTWGPVMRAFLARNKRVWLGGTPACPGLNPVEQVWGWLKLGQLANFVPDGLAQLDRAINNRLKRLRDNRKLLRSLWEGSDLPFPEKVCR